MRFFTTETGDEVIDLAIIKQETSTAIPFIQQHREPLTQIVEWIENFLCCPHPDLGRKGPVCPYVGKSLEHHFFWLAVCNAEHPTSDEICATMRRYQDWYRNMQPGEDEEDAQYKTLLVLFPYLEEQEAYSLLDTAERVLEADFIARKLMLGHFYPRNEHPGLWNVNFRPMDAPVPLLAMRHIVAMDHVNSATIHRMMLGLVQ